MTRAFYVAWGYDEDGVRHEVSVSSVDQLEQVLDEIELAAIQAQHVYDVDLWLSHIAVDEPILLQFLVGHPERSSLLWHEDGVTKFAAVRQIERNSEGISCRRFGDTKIVDPGLTMITPSAVRDALVLYFLSSSLPEFLLWTEEPDD